MLILYFHGDHDAQAIVFVDETDKIEDVDFPAISPPGLSYQGWAKLGPANRHFSPSANTPFTFDPRD